MEITELCSTQSSTDASSANASSTEGARETS